MQTFLCPFIHAYICRPSNLRSTTERIVVNSLRYLRARVCVLLCLCECVCDSRLMCVCACVWRLARCTQSAATSSALGHTWQFGSAEPQIQQSRAHAHQSEAGIGIGNNTLCAGRELRQCRRALRISAHTHTFPHIHNHSLTFFIHPLDTHFGFPFNQF